MAKISVFLKPETHQDLKLLAVHRGLSLTKLVERIVEIYRRDLARRKSAA